MEEIYEVTVEAPTLQIKMGSDARWMVRADDPDAPFIPVNEISEKGLNFLKQVVWPDFIPEDFKVTVSNLNTPKARVDGNIFSKTTQGSKPLPRVKDGDFNDTIAVRLGILYKLCRNLKNDGTGVRRVRLTNCVVESRMEGSTWLVETASRTGVKGPPTVEGFDCVELAVDYIIKKSLY